MNEPWSLPPREAVLRAVVALAAVAAMAVFAAREASPACDEGAYLAVLAGAALLAVAFLAPPPGRELGVGAPLAAAALWALPPGPGRGAAVTLLLAALFAWAAARRLAACLPELPVDAAVPLAFGAQVLLRGGLLFQPQPNVRTLVALLVLPAAAGLSAALLARRHGAGIALLAAGTALVLAPGWNVAATLGLVALTAGDQLSRKDLNRMGRAAALLVLLAPIAWEPAPGLAGAIAGLALSRPRTALVASVPLAAALAWAGLHGHGPAPAPLLGIAWLALLVPTAVQPEPERAWNVPTALILAASVPRIPDVSALAAPLALAALSLPRKGTSIKIQAVWAGAVLAGTALLAGYPWMREEPLAAALSLIGLTPDWRSGAVVAACAVLVMAAGRGYARPLPEIGRAGDGRGARGEGLFAAAAILVALFLHLPPRGVPLLAPESGVTLDASHPAWVAELGRPRPVRGVVVESSLSGGAGLANGTPVATVRLRDDAGQSVLWILRAGEGTGEWAARRPDVAQSALLKSPPAWISWVAGDFLGQRYRARWQLPSAQPFSHLRVERSHGLPAGTGLVVHQVEVRR